MPTPADFRELFVYNRRVFESYLRSAGRLPSEESTTDRGTGHGSVLRTLVHILNVHEIWHNYIVPGRLDELPSSGRSPDEFHDFRAVSAYSRRVWEELDGRLAKLTPRELRRTVRAPWMPGHYTVSDVLYQTTFEQAHHLGELIGLYWQRDRAPPDMTWIDVRRTARRARASASARSHPLDTRP